MFSILLLTGPLEDMFCLLWKESGASHKVTFLSSRLFFPGEFGAGSLWLPEAHGLSRGLGAGRPVGRENELLDGGWFCLLALRHAWLCKARLCAGRQMAATRVQPHSLPLQPMGLSTMSLNIENCLGLK